MKEFLSYYRTDAVALVIGTVTLLLLIDIFQANDKKNIFRSTRFYLMLSITAYILSAVISGYIDIDTGAESYSTKIICEIVQCSFFYLCCFIYTVYVAGELKVTSKAYELLYWLFTVAILAQCVLIAEGKIIVYMGNTRGMGNLYPTYFIYPGIVMIVITAMTYVNSKMNHLQKIILLLYIYLPAIGTVISSVFFDDYLIRLFSMIFIILDFIVVYIDISLNVIQRERELSESRIAVMVSQIQPHFIYNTLNSIAGLCEIEPEAAKKLTIKFSDYLRSSIHSAEIKNPIPFSKELGYVQNYLEIEQVRFRNLRVEYDIQAENFSLPILTIQPLAENAVKHGISKKSGGGTVHISTTETEKWYKITIEDDGVGFNTESQLDNSHLGIENVRNRIENIGGKLKISSKEGTGTTAVVLIPKGGNCNNEKRKR